MLGIALARLEIHGGRQLVLCSGQRGCVAVDSQCLHRLAGVFVGFERALCGDPIVATANARLGRAGDDCFLARPLKGCDRLAKILGPILIADPGEVFAGVAQGQIGVVARTVARVGSQKRLACLEIGRLLGLGNRRVQIISLLLEGIIQSIVGAFHQGEAADEMEVSFGHVVAADEAILSLVAEFDRESQFVELPGIRIQPHDLDKWTLLSMT